MSEMAHLDSINGEPGPAPAQANIASHLTLTSLPFDILRAIVWSERLDRNDVEHLRLTCRSLSDVTVTRLFYRIGISKLNTDRDSFLFICHSPHLASHVRELEWLEITWDIDLFQRIPSNLSVPPGALQLGEIEDDDTESMCHYFAAAAETLFWLPSPPNIALPGSVLPVDNRLELLATHQNTVEGFRDIFQSALDMLPNLHTFVSRPMSSTRLITAQSGYPMVASLFQTFQDTPKFPGPPPETNDGLIHFLIPAMDRPTSTVTRLRWADEFPGHSYVRTIPASAFERLESLELCLTPSKAVSMTALCDIQAACIRAAPSLRHFKLCVEHGSPQASPSLLERVLLGDGLGTAPGCALHSLSLIAVKISEERLMMVLQANASSLRHLYFESMGIKSGLINRLADLSDLKLSTMQVFDDYIHKVVISEHDLVRYINGDRNPDDSDSKADQDKTDVRELVAMGCSVYWATAKLAEHIDGDIEVQSNVGSEDSMDSLDHRVRTAPKWVWSRYFHGDYHWGCIFCHQVPDSDPKGHPTEIWRFTFRSGEKAYGRNPLVWFEEWDPEAGDQEEPTPFCEALLQFSRDGEETGFAPGGLKTYLGEGSQAWELINSLEPPEGAFNYGDCEDPTSNSHWKEHGDWPDWLESQ